MPSAFARFASDDASKFVDPTLFGVAATYIEAGEASGSTIYVNFTEPGIIDDPQSVATIDTRPTALAKTSDVPEAKNGDTLTIDSVAYRVLSAVPDGLGSTVLGLQRESAAQTPAAPTAFQCTTAQGDLPGALSLSFSWTNPGGGDSVEIWAARSGDDEFKFSTFTASATTGTITGTSDEVWTFRLRLVNKSGPGAWSNSINVDTTV